MFPRLAFRIPYGDRRRRTRRVERMVRYPSIAARLPHGEDGGSSEGLCPHRQRHVDIPLRSRRPECHLGAARLAFRIPDENIYWFGSEVRR